MQALENEIPFFNESLRYSVEDIQNPKKTGLKYAMPPDRKISQTVLDGSEEDKTSPLFLFWQKISTPKRFQSFPMQR